MFSISLATRIEFKHPVFVRHIPAEDWGRGGGGGVTYSHMLID